MGFVAWVCSEEGLPHLKTNYPFDKTPEKNDAPMHDQK